MEIEKKVDALLEHKNMKQVNKQKHRTRRIFKGLPIGIIVLLIGGLIALGAILTLYSTYTGSQTGSLELSGVTNDWLWDGNGLTTETFTIPMDLTELSHGESETYTHTIEALAGNGDLDISFDYSAMSDVFTNPSNEWYGFYFDITSDSDVSIINETTYVKAGNPAMTIKFVYSLDDDFLDTDNLLSYDLDVIIEEHIDQPPDTEPDSITIDHNAGSASTLNVFTNDEGDPEGDTVFISAVSLGTGSSPMTIDILDAYAGTVSIHPHGCSTGTVTMTYTVMEENGEHLTTVEDIVVTFN